jgi:hypothetical protein
LPAPIRWVCVSCKLSLSRYCSWLQNPPLHLFLPLLHRFTRTPRSKSLAFARHNVVELTCHTQRDSQYGEVSLDVPFSWLSSCLAMDGHGWGYMRTQRREYDCLVVRLESIPILYRSAIISCSKSPSSGLRRSTFLA